MRWLPVLGWEGLYSVSDTGQVRREGSMTMRNGFPFPVRERVLRQGRYTKGYLQVVLTHNGRKATRKVHILVAEALFGLRPNHNSQVRHLDGNKTNNSLENLVWGTPEENRKDRARLGENVRPTEWRTTCIYGHEYTEENTIWRESKGYRSRKCRECYLSNVSQSKYRKDKR